MKYSILLLIGSNSVNTLNLETLKKIGTPHEHKHFRKEAGACQRLDGVFGQPNMEDYHSHTVKDHDECPKICQKDPDCFGFHYQPATKQCHNFMRADVHGIGKPANEECFVLEEDAREERKKKEEDKAKGKEEESDGDDKDKDGSGDKKKDDDSDDSSKDDSSKKKKSSSKKDSSGKKNLSGKKYGPGDYKDKDMSEFTKAVLDRDEGDDGNVKVKFVTSDSIEDKQKAAEKALKKKKSDHAELIRRLKDGEEVGHLQIGPHTAEKEESFIPIPGQKYKKSEEELAADDKAKKDKKDKENEKNKKSDDEDGDAADASDKKKTKDDAATTDKKSGASGDKKTTKDSATTEKTDDKKESDSDKKSSEKA